MKIQISAQHFEVTEAIEKHIKDKLKRIEKHFEQVINVHIFLKIEKEQHIAEATLHINHHDIFATAHSEDMYGTINTLIGKLDRQIVKHKEKIQVHH